MNRKSLKAVLIILCLIMVMAFSGCTISNIETPKTEAVYKNAFALETREEKPLLTATEAAEKVLPTVVGVLNYAKIDDISHQSEGSGIIMSADGYIVTNAHVIEGAKMLKIVMNDGKVYTAVQGSFWYDTYTDLGVVKIEKEGLPFAEFGNSEELRIAEDVLAIGNPGGIQYQSSVTKGIVSSKNRPYEPNTGSGYVISCIQTDAAINPGNSGGALINLYGQVIGINSAKISAEGYEGMGFAISTNDAQPIIEELMNNHYIAGRPALGITAGMISINALEGEGDQLKNLVGIVITDISNPSFIENGVGTDNLITEVNGIQITSAATVTKALRGLKSGDEVKIKYYILNSYINMGYYGYYTVTSQEATVTLIEFKP